MVIQHTCMLVRRSSQLLLLLLPWMLLLGGGHTGSEGCRAIYGSRAPSECLHS
jgi:hypothetical protein